MASFFCGWWYYIAVCYSPQTNYGACWLADLTIRAGQPAAALVAAAVEVISSRRPPLF